MTAKPACALLAAAVVCASAGQAVAAPAAPYVYLTCKLRSTPIVNGQRKQPGPFFAYTLRYNDTRMDGWDAAKRTWDGLFDCSLRPGETCKLEIDRSAIRFSGVTRYDVTHRETIDLGSGRFVDVYSIGSDAFNEDAGWCFSDANPETAAP
jgi:hypothetical protein